MAHLSDIVALLALANAAGADRAAVAGALQPLAGLAATTGLLSVARLVAPTLERERVYSLRAGGLRTLLVASDALGTRASPTARRLLFGAGAADSDAGFAAAVAAAAAAATPPGACVSAPLAAVDALLAELAALSPFSVDEFGARPVAAVRSQRQIVHALFHRRSPEEAAFLTRVILKTPVTAFHESWVLGVLHPYFWRIYKFQPNLRAACRAIELERSHQTLGGENTSSNQCHSSKKIIQIGANLANMALTKATSCAHVIRHMQNLGEAEFVAEVKYDGERNQVHFNRAAPAGKQITLYSKSKRNSTSDRILCHDILLSALGVKPPTSSSTKALWDSCKEFVPVDSVILDSELLVYNEDTETIEPFHAARVFASEASRSTDEAISSARKHYMLVFFDIMYLNGDSLINLPYSQRRKILESVIRPIPNFSNVSETRIFKLPAASESFLDGGSSGICGGVDVVCSELRKHFLQVCARPAEGLVCKGLNGRYEPGRDTLWMKLKKDYIEGFGDTADFTVVGGSYRHDLTEYLGITRKDDACLLNLFFVACQTNRGSMNEAPRFVVLFDFCAGFSRESLVFFSKSTTPIRYPPSAASKLSYSIANANAFKVDFYFDPPLAVEMKGGGFECRGSGRWALRGPRYLRTCSPDRGWWSTVTYQELAVEFPKSWVF